MGSATTASPTAPRNRRQTSPAPLPGHHGAPPSRKSARIEKRNTKATAASSENEGRGRARERILAVEQAAQLDDREGSEGVGEDTRARDDEDFLRIEHHGREEIGDESRKHGEADADLARCREERKDDDRGKELAAEFADGEHAAEARVERGCEQHRDDVDAPPHRGTSAGTASTTLERPSRSITGRISTRRASGACSTGSTETTTPIREPSAARP